MIRRITPNNPAGQLVGYARVSTTGQDYSAQVERLKDVGCTKVFSEKQSGTKSDREQLAAALEYVREGDTFVCVKADRIARSTKDFLEIVERLDAKGVQLLILDQPEMSTGKGATAKLLRAVLAAVAEFELSLIRDRMAEGRKRAKEEGTKFGRKPKLNPETVSLLKRLKKDEGLSLEAIAVRTGLSMSTVQRGLRT
ncbi:recombinase family protein [Hyphomicrobium sp. ghe19]|uniref:recombinase family protein n=1 Tax=Hyphomicrobium sp. ghe19 TaxID=2682968 RepID=UPI001366C179|nr:Transposon gamma-delta resolvase [Hyphomicrobium sp. ghe19]